MAQPFPYDTQVHVLGFQSKSPLVERIEVHINCITNFDDLLNALIEKGEEHEDYKDERLPYWADLWHAAIGLAQYLVKEEVVTSGMSVTEIGCGLGLPGIVAAKLGGRVTMTDYLPETMDFLQKNWALNTDTPLNAALLDWRTPDSKFQADLLLASDVAYEERTLDVLIPALKVLSKPRGRIIITEPNRAMAKSFLEQLDIDSDFILTRSVIDVKWENVTRSVNVLDLVRI